MREKRDRIIFLDIMRAIAVLMMIQGHTVDTLLSPEFRTFNSVVYSAWFTLRGFTAPIFMFTSGVVFTYLLKLNGKRFTENPRVKKGIKRFMLLLFLGYMLRYPTWRLVDFRYVTDAQWSTFFVVDALHLIGFGLLFIVGLYFIADKLNISVKLLLASVMIPFLLISPLVNRAEWINYLPLWLANYFTQSYGSLFPLFPWLVYMFAGGSLGAYLAERRGIQKRLEFPLKLFATGSFFLLLYFIGKFLPLPYEYISAVNLIFLRLGVVVLLNGVVSFLVLEVSAIPQLILRVGANTLPIYVVHLILLYGSAWTPGLWKYVGRSFSPSQTLLAVALMFLFVILIIAIIENYGRFKKKMLALVGA